MATLVTQTINRVGATAPGYDAAAGGGDSFTPGADVFLDVVNNSGGAITVTVVTPGSVASGIAVSDVAVSVGAGTRKLFGPFPAQHFADPTDGLGDITYSGVTSLTLGVFKISQP